MKMKIYYVKICGVKQKQWFKEKFISLYMCLKEKGIKINGLQFYLMKPAKNKLNQ